MPTGSRKRALVIGIGAFLLFGGWALIANRQHPTADMVRAAAAQGTFSFISSTFGVLLIEHLYGIGRSPRQKLLLGAVGSPAIILLTMTTGHLIAGTPNVVATLLPSWISGAVFCVSYTLGLRRFARQAPAVVPP